MKRYLLAVLLLAAANLAFAQDDLRISGEVNIHETENEGKYFSYTISNTGEQPILGGTYRVYLKVNKKNLSFDRNTSNLRPGEAIRYESNRIFTPEEAGQELHYVLEVTTKKPRKKHQLQEGKITI